MAQFQGFEVIMQVGRATITKAGPWHDVWQGNEHIGGTLNLAEAMQWMMAHQ